MDEMGGVWMLPVAGAGPWEKDQVYRWVVCSLHADGAPGGLYLAFMLVNQKALFTSWEVTAACPGLSRL